MGYHKKHCAQAVYSMTNSSDNNEVVALRRGHWGKLSFINSFPTGGSGTGETIVDPLQSQGSVILSRRGRFLFVVNAGSDSVTSFGVSEYGGLTILDVEPSGGERPNSLAQFRNLLYVTNAGDPGNVASNVSGFRIQSDGTLYFIGSWPLSVPDAHPAGVVFSPNGRLLIVSELNTNLLSVYEVNDDGTLTGPLLNNSFGAGPFGSVFLRKGFLLVSEAGPNALSSYTADVNGDLTVVSGSVLNGQLATCWVSASRNEKFAYTSNAGNGTITAYRVRDNGELFVIDTVFSTLLGDGAPLDSGVSWDGRNFYVLNGNQGSVSVFRIRHDGRLDRIQEFEATGLPEIGAQGLAVR